MKLCLSIIVKNVQNEKPLREIARVSIPYKTLNGLSEKLIISTL